MSATAPNPVPDYTAAEAKTALDELTAGIGSKCDCYLSLGHESPLLVQWALSINPDGLLGKQRIYAKGKTLREVFANGAAAWAVHSDAHAAKIVREIALAIISITADRGECTDQALRATFDAKDVQRYADLACEAATEMASNGPFSVLRTSGANDVEAA